MAILKSGKGTGYKELARYTDITQCSLTQMQKNTTGVVVDVRSRLFMYMRNMKKSVSRKINCVIRMLLSSVDTEVKRVCKEAFEHMKQDANMLLPKFVYYVLCSPERCSFREPSRIADRLEAKTRAARALDKAIQKCTLYLLDVRTMIECHSAFESYIISHVEEVCLMYNSCENQIYDMISCTSQAYDSYESDRLCARMSSLHKGCWILSEDVDCITLFGADRIILTVNRYSVRSVTLDDMIALFQCQNRQELVSKCCIMGTDYNLGIKGIGPKRAKEIDSITAQTLLSDCIRQQSINFDDLMAFFRIHNVLQ